MNKTLISLAFVSALLTGCVLPAGSVSMGAAPSQPRAAAPATTEAGLDYCQNSLDCGSGEFCKDRGDGIKLCMGKGIGGDYCKSSIDCGSGLFCKDRGDGYDVCM